jgi:hypothetical protein
MTLVDLVERTVIPTARDLVDVCHVFGQDLYEVTKPALGKLVHHFSQIVGNYLLGHNSKSDYRIESKDFP